MSKKFYEKESKELAEFSAAAGISPALTQGAGGNVSIKTADGNMLIKASGFRMREVSPDNGISLVSLAPLNKVLGNLSFTEHQLSSAISESVRPLNGSLLKPSVETGFHSMLGSAVLHQHSIYANFISSCSSSASLIAELFPKAYFVTFAMPGYELCLEIKKALNGASAASGLLFLQNHGLVSYADSAEEAVNIANNANEKIIRHFRLPAFHLLESRKDIRQAIDAIKEAKTLTLDQLLYCSSMPRAESINGDLLEIISALSWLHAAMRGCGLSPAYIS